MTSLGLSSPARRLTRRQILKSAAAVSGAASLASQDVVTPVMAFGKNLMSARPMPVETFDASVSVSWFDLILRLVRQTPGYSPPVASRAIACAGLGLYEAVVPGMSDFASLAGIVTDLPKLPSDGHNAAYHWPSVANAALATMARDLFPTAPMELQGHIDALELSLVTDVPHGIAQRSAERGRTIAAAIGDWSIDDGGHEGFLRNFPTDYTPPVGPGLWEPTPPAHQRALQPYWGANRCMALSSAEVGNPGPPPTFSTDPSSSFFAEAVEVYETVNNLTPEQLAIALFWSDDPGRTATPPGHSVSILNQMLRASDASLATAAEAYARLGIALCDAFISCWRTKYEYNLVRPITYIESHIDPGWGNPLPVSTPPFPEYTSGYSVQSGSTATVLTALFGVRPFTDTTHAELGLPARTFGSFEEAAAEAAISRLYGGIHYRAAIERGLEQGRRVGSAALALPMRR